MVGGRSGDGGDDGKGEKISKSTPTPLHVHKFQRRSQQPTSFVDGMYFGFLMLWLGLSVFYLL